MAHNDKNKKAKKAREAIARSRGIARDVHFELGGTPATWRGIHTVTKNGRREASRRACRDRREW
jgi:hypothetical protein